MDTSAVSTAKGASEHSWPMAIISLGVILAFGWVTVFVWLLLSFLMM